MRSFIYSLIAAGYLFVFMTIALVHWIKYASIEDLEESKFIQLYENIKPFRWSRTYSLIFCAKRIVLAAFLVLGFDFSKTIKLGVLIGVQFAYCVYFLILRPFEAPKDNVVEFVPEVGFLAIVGGLNFYERQSRWGSNTEWIFWTAIVASMAVYAFFSFVFMIIAFIDKHNEGSTIIPEKRRMSSENPPIIMPAKDNKSDSVKVHSLEEDPHIDTYRGRESAREERKFQSGKNVNEMYHLFAKQQILGRNQDRTSDNLNGVGSEFVMKKYPNEVSTNHASKRGSYRK